MAGIGERTAHQLRCRDDQDDAERIPERAWRYSALGYCGWVGRSLVANVFLLAFGVVALATVIGLVTLWPQDRTVERPPEFRSPKTESAKIVAVRNTRCTTPGAALCVRVSIRLESGPKKGQTTSFGFAGRDIPFTVGDRIRVYEQKLPEGAQIGGTPLDPYQFSDFERRRPLIALAGIFVGLVLVTARFKGLRALLGLVVSLLLIVFFVVPAILDGESATSVALVGSLAVMFATIVLAHGIGPKSIAACLGTSAALALTLVLAEVFVEAAHLSGLASEEAVYLNASVSTVSVRGLLLAGMVIAALGVLDDLTVTQASTVLALRRANPSFGFAELYRRAVDVGHDHIAATVNTLVLAYAGAALPVLLVFSLAGTPLGEAVSFEIVAGEIVATLVGSIGLITAVPLTTALAALLALRLRPDAVGDVHAHAH